MKFFLKVTYIRLKKCKMLQVCKENFCLYRKIPVKIDQTVRYARWATLPLYSTFLVTISKFSRLIAASRATAVATTTAATPTVGSLSSTLTIRDIYSGRRANTVSTESSVTAVLTMLVSEK